MKGHRGIQQFDPDELFYHVVEWDSARDTRVRVVAAALNVTLAIAAFDAARAEYPNAQMLLMNGARVMRDSLKPRPA